MANTIKVFDFDIDIHSARVVVREGLKGYCVPAAVAMARLTRIFVSLRTI
jgi:hypothetical protein